MKVTIVTKKEKIVVEATKNTKLSKVLCDNRIFLSMDCGGNGLCKKPG